jgi:hypothetical protein
MYRKIEPMLHFYIVCVRSLDYRMDLGRRGFNSKNSEFIAHLATSALIRPIPQQIANRHPEPEAYEQSSAIDGSRGSSQLR